MAERNLIVIIHPKLLDYRDFEEIGKIINAKNSGIRMHILSFDDDIPNFPGIDWRLPTFSISLAPQVRTLPTRGNFFFCRQIDKLTQVEILKTSGISVPMTNLYERNYFYDPREWGDFVIIKTRRLEGSSKGNTAHLTPTRFLGHPEIFNEPVRSILLSGDALVQEFINTGVNPVEHRATMFLGRVLYFLEGKTSLAQPALDPTVPIAAVFDSKMNDPNNGIIRSRRLIVDTEMIALAQNTAKAFPGIPLLGVDLLKNYESGKIYVLEINAGGNTWHFSSPSVAEGRKYVTRDQRIAQFGAWDIAANALIEKTLHYAK